MEARVGVAGCTNMTLEFVEALRDSGVRIAHLITIAPHQAARNKVANYRDLQSWASAAGVPVLVPKTYSLKDAEDAAAVNRLGLDVLFVIGWQRLIPASVLTQLRIGAFGMHGSPDGLPRGRGRSPLNWSLITGRTSFKTYLFRYDPYIDSGDYVDFVEFDINPFDTCETLHLKNLYAMIYLVRKYLPALLDGVVDYRRQQGEATYYPKREAEDGGIDWTCTAEHIHNFVRALTRPFPGAFTFADDQKVFIWRGQPFDSRLPFAGHPGEIVAMPHNGYLVVQTGEGTYLVIDYQGADGHQFTPAVGMVLRSVPHDENIQRIVKRYPDFVEEHQKEIRVKASR